MNKLKYNLLCQLQSRPLSMAEVYRNAKTINQTRSTVKELLQCGLIVQNPISRAFSITASGLLALEQEKRCRSDSKRYWVTTAIAILALIISGLSLLSELGLLELPKY